MNGIRDYSTSEKSLKCKELPGWKSKLHNETKYHALCTDCCLTDTALIINPEAQEAATKSLKISNSSSVYACQYSGIKDYMKTEEDSRIIVNTTYMLHMTHKYYLKK